MTLHAFVDESHRQTHLLVATLLKPAELDGVRVLVRGLLLPGARRLHFQSEGDGRRRTAVARLVSVGPRVRIYESRGAAEPARAAALDRLTEDLVKLDASRLVLESRGESADRRDRQVIARRLADAGATRLSYEHLRPHEDPVLWVSDAVAWCFGAGGDWRRRVRPLVDEVISVRTEGS